MSNLWFKSWDHYKFIENKLRNHETLLPIEIMLKSRKKIKSMRPVNNLIEKNQKILWSIIIKKQPNIKR